MSVSTFMLIAGIAIAFAGLMCVITGAFHTFRNGSPSGAIALLLGIVALAFVLAHVVIGAELSSIFGGSAEPTSPVQP